MLLFDILKSLDGNILIFRGVFKIRYPTKVDAAFNKIAGFLSNFEAVMREA